MNWDHASLSRDIAAAMFRVAAVTKNGKISDAIESSAILLVSSQDQTSAKKAEEIIRFGEAVGEIKPINVRVLVRELNNLKKLIQDEEQSGNVDISSLFARQTFDGGEASDVREATDVRVEARPVSQSPRHAGQASENGATPRGDNRSLYGAKSVGRASLYNSGQKMAESGDNSGRRSSISPDKIFLYINERGQARLKELESAFPEVSGRTLRRTTDLLIRERKIERVGNPGPSSYYRPLGKSVPAAFPTGHSERSEESPVPGASEPTVAEVLSRTITSHHDPVSDTGEESRLTKESAAIPAQIGTFQRITTPSFMRAIPADSAE